MDFEEMKALVIEKVKYFYFFFEDRWYRLLDRIDKQVPVYKMVDPIDQVIPSYILLLLLVLFVLILIGYLMSFNNTYDIKIVTLDADTEQEVGGVNVFGSVNEADFDEFTDTQGILEFPVTGPPMNFFQVFARLLFPQEDEFEFVLSTEKEGYVSLEEQDMLLTTELLEGEIYLSPIEGGDGDGQYPNSIDVSLRDKETLNLIKDSSSYIKFRCNNNSAITTQTVRDEDDGSLDGSFALNQEDCQFLITEIGADGYETVNNSFILTDDRRIDLNPIEDTTTGQARILALEQGADPEKSISGISVKINRNNGDSLTMVGSGTTNNSGTILISDLDPGTYVITAQSTDVNNPYYSINADHNITIDITVGDTTNKTIYFNPLDPNNVRKINIKVIDANSSDPIVGAELSVFRKRENDSNSIIADEALFTAPPYTVSSDTNGLIQPDDILSVDDEGQLIGVIKKSEYVYKIFEVDLFRTGEGPQIIELEEANMNEGGNAGSAQINVYEGPIDGTNKIPLRLADTTLYIKKPSLGIERVPIETGVTDSSGQSFFYWLPVGTYSASATYLSAFTGISIEKALDVNQHVVFDLNLDADSSYLVVKVYDIDDYDSIVESGGNIDDARITSADARVKVYTLEGSGDLVPTLVEEIEQEGTNFRSLNYFPEEKIMIEATAPGYATGSIDILNGLANGPNDYTLFLQSTADLTGKVNIFYRGTFLDSALSNRNIVWDSGGSFYSKFDVILNDDDTNYTDLLSMVRMEDDFVDIENVTMTSPIVFHDESDVFSLTTKNSETNTTANDPAEHEDNYYYPTSSYYREEEGKQAGTKWRKDELSGDDFEFGNRTFTMVVKFSLGNFEDDERLSIEYRAKEKNSSSDSETELKTEEIVLGVPQCMTDYCFEVNLNSSGVGFSQESDTKFESAEQHKIEYQIANPYEIRIYNATDSSSSGELKVFSASSATSITEGGNIHFESFTGDQSHTLNNDLSVPARGYNTSPQTGELFNDTRASSDYFVVEYTPTGGSSFRAYVDTFVPGKTLELRNPEFIAGLEDQNFLDYVDSVFDNETPELDWVTIDVYEDCDGDNNYVGSASGSAIIGVDGINSFLKTIPGVYNAYEDCLWISAESSDIDYASLNEQVWASTGGTVDPGLACIDILGVDDVKEVYLNWGETTDIKVINKCDSTMKAYIDVGLECSIVGSSNDCDYKQTIAPNDILTYRIKGENITYNSNVKFSDILGFFPVEVKAKRSTDSQYKEYAIADKLNIHLRNDEECFIISNDAFDLSETTFEDFYFENECQYTQFGDYFVPKVKLQSFGAIVNNPNEVPVNSLDFGWALQATGAQYVTTMSTSLETGYWQGMGQDLNDYYASSEPVSEKDYRLYKDITYDLSHIDGKIKKIQFNWSDFVLPYEEETVTYGAAVSGDFTINYEDGTSQTFSQDPTFNLDPPVSCECGGTQSAVGGKGSTCTINNLECLMGTDTYDGGDSNYIYGLAYAEILNPKENPSSLVFDVIANADPSRLDITIIPEVEYEVSVPNVSISGDSVETFSLGEFTIYPYEGMTYILRNVSYGESALGKSLPEKYCVASSDTEGHGYEQAWYDSSTDKIYWVENAITTYSRASDTCAGEGIEQGLSEPNLLDVEGANLANFNIIDDSILSDMQSYISSQNPQGAWGESQQILTGSTITSEGDTTIPDKYIFACEYDVPNDIIVRDSYCTPGIINVVCQPDQISGEDYCHVEESLESNIFFTIDYLGSRNPSVRLLVESINYDYENPNQALVFNGETGAVAIWIEGRYLKARFLGEDIEEFNDGTIESQLENDFLAGTRYAIINIEDYIRGS